MVGMPGCPSKGRDRRFSCRMGEVPARLLLFDSTQITAAAADLRTAFKQPGAIAELCAVFSTNQQPQVL